MAKTKFKKGDKIRAINSGCTYVVIIEHNKLFAKNDFAKFEIAKDIENLFELIIKILYFDKIPYFLRHSISDTEWYSEEIEKSNDYEIDWFTIEEAKKIDATLIFAGESKIAKVEEVKKYCVILNKL